MSVGETQASVAYVKTVQVIWMCGQVESHCTAGNAETSQAYLLHFPQYGVLKGMERKVKIYHRIINLAE